MIPDVLLGEQTYASPDCQYAYEQAGGWLLPPKQLQRMRCSGKTDMYEHRIESIALLFQRIIQARDLNACPVRGEGGTGALVLGSV